MIFNFRAAAHSVIIDYSLLLDKCNLKKKEKGDSGTHPGINIIKASFYSLIIIYARRIKGIFSLL